MDAQGAPGEKAAGEVKFWFSFMGALTLLWLLAFLPQWFVWSFLAEFFGFFAALAGVLGSFVWLIAAAALRSRRLFAVAVMLGVSSFAALSGIPNTLKAHVTLFANEGRYRAFIDEVVRAPSSWKETYPNEHVLVDNSASSVRVAFNLRNGMIDDFSAIVYDPSGVVALASSRENKEVFEGVLGAVRHLRGPWYYGILYPD